MALAVRTSIPVETWLAGDPRAMFTAMALINEADRDVNPDDDRVYEG